MKTSSDSGQSSAPANQDFYLAFENLYRGSTESIHARQSVYLPYVKALKSQYPDLKALDLGCGRGEWLGLLQKEGVEAIGVDLDNSMLEYCKKNQFNVKRQDALGALKELPDATIGVITGFHIAEHMPFNQLIALCAEALRVLYPGGLLILETPNSENIHVASSTFHLDPTHNNPLPAKLLAFLLGFNGFSRVAQIGLNPDIKINQNSYVTLQHVLLSGVSRDYAVIGQKTGNIEELGKLFDAAQGGDLSTLEEVADRFDAQLLQAYALLEDQQRRIARLETPLRFIKKILSPFLKK